MGRERSFTFFAFFFWFGTALAFNKVRIDSFQTVHNLYELQAADQYRFRNNTLRKILLKKPPAVGE